MGKQNKKINKEKWTNLSIWILILSAFQIVLLLQNFAVDRANRTYDTNTGLEGLGPPFAVLGLGIFIGIPYLVLGAIYLHKLYVSNSTKNVYALCAIALVIITYIFVAIGFANPPARHINYGNDSSEIFSNIQ